MLRELNNSETEKIIAKQNYRDDLNNLRQYKSDLKKIALQVSASHSFHAFSGETTFQALLQGVIRTPNDVSE